MIPNHDLAEEIRAYWSDRAGTFDRSFAHAIAPGTEFDGWCAALARHLPPAPADILELGCGTGEITRVLAALGHGVRALDFCEPMLARARAKHAGNAMVSLGLADAQRTMEPAASRDAVICRHLVWTLTKPDAAFADWLRVLRPGGRLVILDGNWAVARPAAHWIRPVIRLLARLAPDDPVDGGMLARHDAIMRRLPYGGGLTAARLKADLEAAGFTDVQIHDYNALNRAMSHRAALRHRLRLHLWDRFIVTASRAGSVRA
ncbi:class I SAM-dependent methyltransferase [Gemmobacter sp.]|uniref:class I SAM-dependent methyltransferase n=1 Tax=Gemmobacter sp. TaxID=1898957 RepID=UPI002AFFEA53|nr:methyltransferase domain-containing protein [Gemmobacter sp.]